MWQLLERLKVIAKKHDTRCGISHLKSESATVLLVLLQQYMSQPAGEGLGVSLPVAIVTVLTPEEQSGCNLQAAV